MNKEKFIKYIRSPAALQEASNTETSELIDQYPYSSILHLFNAKFQQLQDHDDQEEALHQAATYVYDREQLYHFMNDTPAPSSLQKDQKESTSTASPGKSFFDWLQELDSSSKDKEASPSPQTEQKKEKKKGQDFSLATTEEDEKAFEHFRSSTQKKGSAKTDTTDDTIDDMAKKSVAENENIVTETLALIHINQGNIKKAIAVYQQLRLQYPEKSRYFAKKIKELKGKG